MTRIAVIAALPEEADAFRSGEGEVETRGGLPLRRIAADGIALSIATSGMGKVNAAHAAAMMIHGEDADMLMVIGTAGRLSDISGDCFWIVEALQHDYGAAHEAGFRHYDAGAWPFGDAQVTPFAALSDPGTGLPAARIASGDCFVEDGARARAIAEGLACQLVDMEVGAVAQVAAGAGVPWAAIKAVSDDADGESAGDFMANLRIAAARAAGAGEGLASLIAQKPEICRPRD